MRGGGGRGEGGGGGYGGKQLQYNTRHIYIHLQVQ
jgi:hypothetical protein